VTRVAKPDRRAPRRPPGAPGARPSPRLTWLLATSLALLAAWAIRAWWPAQRDRAPAPAPQAALAQQPALAQPSPSPSLPPVAPASPPPRADGEAAALARLRPRVLGLFHAKGQIGPGAARRAEELEAELFSDPDASSALRALYGRLPAEAVEERWSVIETLGDHPSPENVSLLRQAATAPEGAADDPDVKVRRRAALGVLEAYARNEPTAAEALRDVLANAGPSAARAVALELWRRGLTTSWQRQLLQARGLTADFRPLTAEENERFRPKLRDEGVASATVPSQEPEPEPEPE
jgi:hypothetical protein